MEDLCIMKSASFSGLSYLTIDNYTYQSFTAQSMLSKQSDKLLVSLRKFYFLAYLPCIVLFYTLPKYQPIINSCFSRCHDACVRKKKYSSSIHALFILNIFRRETSLQIITMSMKGVIYLKRKGFRLYLRHSTVYD